MHFQRWLPAAQYDPNYTTMAKAELHESLAGLDSWQQAAATELFWGTIIKHEFLVTPVPHPSHEELFGEERILEAIVSLAGHLVVEHEGETLKLRNLHHAVPIEVTASLRDLLPLLKAIDDKRNVAEVLTIFLDGTPDDPQLILDSMSLIRSLVGADLLDLRRPDERSP
jgi:hypothetical protein